MVCDHNLYSLLSSRFLGSENAIAFRVPGQGTVSYGQLDCHVARYAHALSALGLKPGDRLAVQIEKSLTNIFVYLAALRMGAVYQPLNTAYTAREVEYFIGDSQPAVVISQPERLAELEPIARRHDVGAIAVLDANGGGDLTDLAAGQPETFNTVAREPDDLAGLFYTSGTTGRSKGAMITHGNLASNALTLHKLWRFEPGDVLLHALPVFHVHGLQIALHTAFLNGSEIIWLPRFDAAQVMTHLSAATVMMGVPTFYTRLLDTPDFGANTCANMRLFISGSAPLLAETHTAFTARTGKRILERYGMTETGMITSNPYDGERVAGTVGFALPGVDVRIADDDGAVLGPGETGVLEVRGPNVFKGYWRQPEKTASEFRADGYFITGDMAVMASDGRVTIAGRAKDLIISGGFNVYPKEVESELDALDGIDESAVIGVPHPDFGEGVVAVVTVNGAPPDAGAIITALGKRLAKFKVPKQIFTTTMLPRNTMGKVQKAELRKIYANTFG